ncbi:YjjW family glycine radical enzyme activase [Vibrio genomosp. F6]|uniref:YjjW family glycine radical enzyme activase n=1 Tax=Vibrio genomosp. F6 TaxID=723172 RepID=UPI0010BDAFE8|nr:YjjW family glycine radical enzyme activase [Vibrio genomosp. F6]TKF21029.1 YjjW family glycine radical enzyme activase [Vibrio genomosp. F6]
MARVNIKSTTEKQAKVSRVLTFSCVDGPGNRLVIFLQGCNFDCISCHNPHTINHCNHCGDCVSHCPADALSLDADLKVKWDPSKCTQCDKCIDVCQHKSNPKIQHFSVSQMIELIRKNHVFLSGITVSGGEATLQIGFIVDLFKAIKQDAELNHLSCFIDSNGSLSLSGWQKVEPYFDGAMIDLKAWQNETHQWLVGRDNHRVFQSMAYLAEVEKLYEVRLLHIPGKTDLQSEVESVGHYLNRLPESVKVRLNAFQHHGVIGEALQWETCGEVDMMAFHQELIQYVKRDIQLPSVYM